MEGRRFFQFIAGDRKGEVLLFDKIETDDGLTFICFKDNSRCNEELILPLNDHNWEGKYMAEVSDSNNIWKFKEEWVGRQEEQTALNAEQVRVIIQPFVEGRKKVTPIPPKKMTSQFGAITNHIEPVIIPEPKSVVEEKKVDDPVFLMVDKSRKFDTTISLDMIISLPKESLYNVIDESFENGGSKMVNYIVDNMDIEIIKDSLRQSLLNAYNGNDDKYINEEKDIVDTTEVFEPEVVEESSTFEPDGINMGFLN